MLAPLFALIAILVKIEDGGPVFFLQTRVGSFGREFKMYKIRSMCLDAEQRLKEISEKNHHKEGVTFKLKDDPRITRVGKWLRKFSFDELPQLYNVLIGDMSLVGTAPALAARGFQIFAGASPAARHQARHHLHLADQRPRRN